jgi:hypothetical protein
MLVSTAQLLARSQGWRGSSGSEIVEHEMSVRLPAECLLGQDGKVVQHSRCCSVVQGVMCVWGQKLRKCASIGAGVQGQQVQIRAADCKQGADMCFDVSTNPA